MLYSPVSIFMICLFTLSVIMGTENGWLGFAAGQAMLLLFIGLDYIDDKLAKICDGLPKH